MPDVKEINGREDDHQAYVLRNASRNELGSMLDNLRSKTTTRDDLEVVRRSRKESHQEEEALNVMTG